MSEGDWDSERSEVAHSEARAVIEAQNEAMSEINEKAMRTVRINALIGGLFITAYQYRPETFDGTSTVAAVGLLACSAAFCIFTYDGSDLFLGPDGGYLTKLANGGIGDGEWEQDLIEVFAGMISLNHKDIRRNSLTLKISLILLIMGVGVGFVSVVI